MSRDLKFMPPRISCHCDKKKMQCGYVIIVMAIYWMTAVLPMGITGLIPVFMFPMFGVIGVMEVATNYIKNIHLLLMGSMFVAIAIEQHGIHRRVALGALEHHWNITQKTENKGEMNACIRNYPPSSRQDAELGEVNMALDTDENDGIKVISHRAIDEAGDTKTDDAELLVESKYLSNTAAMIALAASYGSNIGGVATMIGTNPNVYLYGQMEMLYKSNDMDSPLTYVTWLAMGVPSALIALVFCYILLQLYFLGMNCCPGSSSNLGDTERSKAALKKQQAQLPPMSWAEGSTLFFFLLLTLLFFFRKPGFMTGYGTLFGTELTDAVPAILVATLLFIFPSKLPKILCFRKKGEEAESVPSLLEWKTSGPRLPWSALLLIGGAFAIEMGSKKSGLSDWLKIQLQGLESLPDIAVLCVCMLVVTIFTNITCGMATSSVFIPIYINMASAFDIHPLYLVLPSCLMASSTFMLPASNPTNAIVYETGLLRIKDMVICGFFMNIIFFLINLLGAETWMTSLFDLNTLPFNETMMSPMPSMAMGGGMMPGMGH
ncbi:hypothetical protein CAPTEDRAFT_215953 [Capitella teleta]|uniref:Citrate transporter-like domain-containing protein n=1 Tax=Capitella teleta TaxID=283909 RepID=R7V9D1_CAPTE|nr:hypothetical protein CAPTEDRAFT_215953 [Capitella teleta]|eukprot:ELU15107.1 hypothetical protein CAPTEDRAFT_215953 [Capitella teleta]